MENNNRKNKGYWLSKFTDRGAYDYTVGVWSSLNQRCVNGRYVNSPATIRNKQQLSYLAKGIRLELTQEEFYTFTANNESLIASIISKGLKPSIDRIDPDKHYSLDNIRILELQLNRAIGKANIGVSGKVSKIEYYLRNRLAYITGQKFEPKVKLVIDDWVRRYFKFPQGIGLLTNLIEKGEFENYSEKLKDEVEIPKKVIQTYLKMKEQKAATEILQKEIDEKKKLKKLKSTSKRETISQRKTKRKEIKNHPDYQNLYQYIHNRRKALLSVNEDIEVHQFDSEIFDRLPRDLIIDMVAVGFKGDSK